MRWKWIIVCSYVIKVSVEALGLQSRTAWWSFQTFGRGTQKARSRPRGGRQKETRDAQKTTRRRKRTDSASLRSRWHWNCPVCVEWMMWKTELLEKERFFVLQSVICRLDPLSCLGCPKSSRWVAPQAARWWIKRLPKMEASSCQPVSSSQTTLCLYDTSNSRPACASFSMPSTSWPVAFFRPVWRFLSFLCPRSLWTNPSCADEFYFHSPPAASILFNRFSFWNLFFSHWLLSLFKAEECCCKSGPRSWQPPAPMSARKWRNSHPTRAIDTTPVLLRSWIAALVKSSGTSCH